MAAEVVQDKVVMHPRPYLEVKLKQRELHLTNCGTYSLPEPKQGTLPPVDKNSEVYRNGLPATQTAV
eukprot:2013350-Prorocentrum_lima.AAC.1